jgi:hypothetical protein
VLETRRADDARHVRELETKLKEADAFITMRPKLQAKLMSQQTELTTTKRELADAKQLAELAENRIADAHEQLEMATLDKEVAEERAELAEAELEEFKEKLAVLEVENKALQGEDSEWAQIKLVQGTRLTLARWGSGYTSTRFTSVHSTGEAERATEGGFDPASRCYPRYGPGAAQKDIRHGEGCRHSRRDTIAV